MLLFFYFILFIFFYFILLYNTVLVLPYIDMNPPRVYMFVYILFLAALGCLLWALLSYGEWGLLSSCSAEASHCGGFSCCGERTLDVWASVVVAHGLSGSTVCGIFAEQRLSPALAGSC